MPNGKEKRHHYIYTLHKICDDQTLIILQRHAAPVLVCTTPQSSDLWGNGRREAKEV